MSKVEDKKEVETPKKSTTETKKKTQSKAKTESDKTTTKKTASNKTTTKKPTEKKAEEKNDKTIVAKESKTNKVNNDNKEKAVKKTTKKTVKKEDIKEETEKKLENVTKKSTKKEVKKETENKIKKENNKKENNKKENDKKEKEEKEELIEKETVVEEIVDEEVSEATQEVKEKTISLKDIKTVLKNKVSNVQKRTLLKEELINIGSAVLMIFHLFLLYMGSKNIELNILINDMKIITLCILAIGIGILEFSYKKDEIKIALRGLEVLVFGASNLCLIYVARLYFNEVVHFVLYIGAVIIVYYIIKIIITSIYSVRKYKKDNNDIKDIVKK